VIEVAQGEGEKKRVYELARELNLSSEALLKVLSGMQIKVKSHMSTLTPEQADQVRKRFEREKQKARSRAARSKKRRRKKKKKKSATSTAEAEKTVKDTLAKIDSSKSRTRKKRRRKYKEEKHERHEKQVTTAEEEDVLRITEFTSPSELADMMGVNLNKVISKCLELGVMATANQRLDIDTLTLLGAEFGYEVEKVSEYGAEELEQKRKEKSEREVTRPPVVTIMGHVDHGKTALLDRIRSTNVIASESGGITQHIGAYVADVGEEGHKITFIDTPGHEAFTAMRTRGAQVTDIVVLVVAADSKVMPQTEEAIDHARAAGVPILVTISKMDLPTANPERIKQDLAGRQILVEEWGGEVLCAEVSAITGEGVDDLLEKILLQAELLELTAYPDRPARGAVLEGKIDPRRGSVVNVLVQDGTLYEGDCFVAGQYRGRIRAMYDENDNQLDSVGPSFPVQILGSSGVPEAGDSFTAVDSEQEAKEVSRRRQVVERERDLQTRRHVTLEDFWRASEEGEGILNLIVKADVQGSAEAIVDTLTKMGSDEVSVEIVHSGVGGITEGDVMLAAASDAVVIGFRVRPDIRAREKANSMGVEINTFNVIYDVQETIKKALSGLLKPEEKEEFLGSAEVREIFKVPNIGNVAGCYVVGGTVSRNAMARLVRDGVEVWNGRIASLKHFQEDRKEISAGFECGIGLEGFQDLKVGDIIECYRILEISREL
jgi:translation initiation factor IF-2